MDMDNHFKNFDKKFNRIWTFAWIWIIFCMVLALALLGGLGFVVYKLLVHFGVL